MAPVRARRLGKPKRIEEAVPSSGVGNCGMCEGRVVAGTWIHSFGCPHMAVRWHRHEKMWDCPYGCPGEELAESTTHHWACSFWAEHPELVPF